MSSVGHIFSFFTSPLAIHSCIFLPFFCKNFFPSPIIVNIHFSSATHDNLPLFLYFIYYPFSFFLSFFQSTICVSLTSSCAICSFLLRKKQIIMCTTFPYFLFFFSLLFLALYKVRDIGSISLQEHDLHYQNLFFQFLSFHNDDLNDIHSSLYLFFYSVHCLTAAMHSISTPTSRGNLATSTADRAGLKGAKTFS